MAAPLQSDLDQLLAFRAASPRLLVLTGAGISAGSGIPTYRDAEGTWLRATPITHQEFLRDPARRRLPFQGPSMPCPALAITADDLSLDREDLT